MCFCVSFAIVPTFLCCRCLKSSLSPQNKWTWTLKVECKHHFWFWTILSFRTCGEHFCTDGNIADITTLISKKYCAYERIAFFFLHNDFKSDVFYEITCYTSHTGVGRGLPFWATFKDTNKALISWIVTLNLFIWSYFSDAVRHDTMCK